MLYFTADTHFGHENVLKLDGRPFATVEEMDEALIANWNAVVRPCDTVWHLGDFLWRTDIEYAAGIIERLNGEIRLLKGNHDNVLAKLLEKGRLPVRARAKIAYVGDYREVRSERKRFVMSHYPMPCYNGRFHTKKGENEGIYMLHGHVHATFEQTIMQALAYGQNPPMQLVNVGCMLWGYAPVSIAQIEAACKRPCGNRADSECRNRWWRGCPECEGCAFGSYWHGDRSFGHLANPDLFKPMHLGRWQCSGD